MLEAVTAATDLGPPPPATGAPVITVGQSVTPAPVRHSRAHTTNPPVPTAGAAVTAAPSVPSVLAAVTVATVPKRTHVAHTPGASQECVTLARQASVLARG